MKVSAACALLDSFPVARALLAIVVLHLRVGRCAELGPGS